MPTTSVSHDCDATTDLEQTTGPRVALPHLLLPIVLLATACDMPRYQGPQLQRWAEPSGTCKRWCSRWLAGCWFC